MHHTFERDGFETVAGLIGTESRQELINLLGSSASAGKRGLLANPAVSDLARSALVLNLCRPHMDAEPVPVRAIYFDKSLETNWLVPWHQDLTIAVREQVEASGFGPWSTKGGIPHVQPPLEFLQRMLTVRIHLDLADGFTGALRVMPGSHRFGRFSSNEIREFRNHGLEHLCVAAPGDCLLMRPLLLHASSRSTGAGHRRILHIEFADFSLPAPLQWHDAA